MNRAKRYLIASFFLLATAQAQAQDTNRIWTLDDCMRYAVSHGFDVQSQAIAHDNSRSDYRRSVASFFPTVSASVGGQYSFGRSIDPATNTYNSLKTFNNSYSLGASWTIFSGGQIVNDFRQAKALTQSASAALQNAKDETALKVMEAYVNVQYYRALSEITAAKLEESRGLLLQARRMKELGMNSAVEVGQAEAQFADDDHNHTVTAGLLRSAMLSLKSTMNFPLSDSINLPDPTGSAPDCPITGKRETNVDDILGFAILNNPLSVQANYEVEASRLAVRSAKGALFPTLSLEAGLSDYYYRHIGSANQSYSTQMNNNFGQYVGITMSIPLFSGLSRQNSLHKAKNSEINARLERERTLQTLDTNIRQAVIDCDNARMEAAKMESKVLSDSVACRQARRKYEEGLMDFLDMQQLANTWYESQAELVRCRLTYAIKQRLVEYYRTNILIFD